VPRPARRAGWRALGIIWAAVLVVLSGGAAVLQVLGPPQPRRNPPPVSVQASPPAAPVVAKLAAVPPPQVGPRPGRDTPGPITDPDPALGEPAPGLPDRKLPRIAEDGRMPMQLYAAGFDQSDRRPRVGLVLAGFGLDVAASEDALRTLPGDITLAVSPYATNPERLLTEARMSEHEYLLSIPREPESFPLNDPGDHALSTRVSPEDNNRQLIWVLSRFQGYVGATGALGLTRGERFASVPDEMNPVLAALAQRGLLYVDPRPGESARDQGRLPMVWSRDVDVVIDEPDDAASIDVKLVELNRIAQRQGSALGLAGAVRPVTVDRIAVWANELAANGLALAPVSALVEPPARPSGGAQAKQ
jgi:polysaccharide deacetylase 2 family uncharacterized protein YibQ